MEALLGTPMARSDENPLRWEGGPVQLGPSLQVVSSVIGIADDSWMFAAIEIEPTPCISLEMVMAHYPEVKLKSAPTGHSVYEQALWAISYDWGDLAFGSPGEGALPYWHFARTRDGIGASGFS